MPRNQTIADFTGAWPTGYPRVKYLGFTSRQWPFLFVLVGNWIFALAFFLSAKLIWHRVPLEKKLAIALLAEKGEALSR